LCFREKFTTNFLLRVLFFCCCCFFHALFHLFVFPSHIQQQQTLMKFHPSFDAVLASIVMADPLAVVLVTYSTNQPAWQQALERRIARSIAEAEAAAEAASAGTGTAAEEAKEILNSFTSTPAPITSCAYSPSTSSSSSSHHGRVRFLPALPHASFLTLLEASSVVLDPFPFGGGVTSLEALAVGTPVVTLPSQQSVVQLAYGFYLRMGQQQDEMERKVREEVERGGGEGGEGEQSGEREAAAAAAAAAEVAAWPVATSKADFVSLAVAIATADSSGDASPSGGKKKRNNGGGGGNGSSGRSGSLRERLRSRILSNHAILYEDKSAAAEWTELLLRLGGRRRRGRWL
jgi:hypothetical protein